jgi:hypothetical protein
MPDHPDHVNMQMIVLDLITMDTDILVAKPGQSVQRVDIRNNLVTPGPGRSTSRLRTEASPTASKTVRRGSTCSPNRRLGLKRRYKWLWFAAFARNRGVLAVEHGCSGEGTAAGRL